jgi:probable HAF family extracellular repeat protein
MKIFRFVFAHQRAKSVFQLFTLLAIFAVCNSAQAVEYEIYNLGSLTANGASWAYGINNSGQIVGRAQTSAGSIVACIFDYENTTNNTSLGVLTGYSNSYAYSINNAGTIVGWSQNDSSDMKACDFTSGSAVELAGQNGMAIAINNAGITIGRYDNKAYNFTTDAQLSTQDSYALSINNTGTVVGIEADTGGNYFACIFDTGTNITLSNFESYAYSINDAGQIVGDEKDIACIFDPTGSKSNTTLGTLGGTYSRVTANNAFGQIVGFAQDADGNLAACLFDSTGNKNNINLNDLINPALGWNLRYAYDINDDGWIVGVGLLDGVETAYLLKAIPEPATLAIFGLGGLLFIRKKRILNC